MTTALVSRLKAQVERSSFLRFLISGGLNTVSTYAIYLVLLQVMGYRIAYTISYVFGIILAFFINRFFVFKAHRGWRSAVFFPLVYLAQYLVSLAVVWAWVEKLHLGETLAPLVAIAVTIPLTFILSRLVFGRETRR